MRLKRLHNLVMAAAMLVSGEALAHPHILVKAKASILFNAQGEVTGVAHIWDFDKAFSAFAVQGYDSRHDGLPSRADLQPLAKINMNSLSYYKYFTSLVLDGKTYNPGKPTDFYDTFSDDTLEIHFTLNFAKPLAVKGKSFSLRVYDPEYFAAVSFARRDPVTLAAGHPDCDVTLHRPGQLAPAVAAKLAAIPASQHDVPAALFAVTNLLINSAEVACK
ncbi:MAG: DUF1007 family protein [Hyphomicrobiales bacterium]|nr:DUF1007 family protein [Hyphomicrobiales bacterium]